MKLDIQRNETTYVHRSDKHRSGWDAEVNSGYSDFLLRGTSPLDLLTTAYALCKTRVVALLGIQPVTLSFHPKDNKTNGKLIFVSTEVADNKRLPPSYKLDVMLGATTHEVAHVLYSDFTQEFKSNFHHRIMNIIEDEAIEHRIGESFPGLASQLEVLKHYYFDFKYSIRKPKGPVEELFDCFFKLVRYPKYLQRALVKKHNTALQQIKDILSPYPMTPVTLYDASSRILDIFEAIGGIDADKVKDTLEGIAKETGFLMPAAIDKAGVKVSATIAKDAMAYDIVTAKAEYRAGSKTYFVKATGSPAAYLSIRGRVVGEARKLANLLAMDKTDEMVIERRMPEGALDETMLVEAMCGTKNIYAIRNFRPASDPRVVLVMDESGSMGGKKIESLKETAVIVREAIRMTRGQLFAYGYTSDRDGGGTNTITIYAEPGLKAETAMASISSKDNNRDGVCLEEVGARVRGFTDERMLMLVISDGDPIAQGYSGSQAVEHTGAVVDRLTKDGFLVVQIGIELTKTTEQAKMFKNHVNYTNSSDMVKQLCNLVRPLLRRLHA